MKSLILVLALTVVPVLAQAKTVKVGGALASAIDTLAGQYGNADAAMGHSYSNTQAVTCVKHVDESNDGASEIKCDVSYLGKTQTISTKSDLNAPDAFQLRRLLIEATKNDRKVSSTDMKISVKSVDCASMMVEHEFDSLEIEADTSCTIKF